MNSHTERFEKLFGPQSFDRPGLPGSLRKQVYERMFYLFNAKITSKKAMTYFRSVFHPDRPDSVFSREERHQVFVTIDHLFRGKKL